MKKLIGSISFFLTISLNAQNIKTVAINDTISLKASLQYSDDFARGLSHWNPQKEVEGSLVEIIDGKMDITTKRGCTVWFDRFLEGPLMIEYDAVMIDEGGSLDRVSDLNCFWMATDPNDPKNNFIKKDELSGSLGDYNKLKLYYVGQGGRKNTTTRFRRYPGTGERPMLPEHNLRNEKFLLKANKVNHVKIIVYHNIIQYYRNDQLIFNFYDPEPHSKGYFGLRTTINHMSIDNFKVYNLIDNN
jgi:hypothetical protein